jgi:hypothetical protein
MASESITQAQDGPQGHASWLDLPPEVRFEILSLVPEDHREHRPDPLQNRRLALFATVCSEWQYTFERMTFRHLLVNNTALEDLARIMSGTNTRRTSYLRHLSFQIVLPGYSCPSCHTLENWFEIHRYVPSSNIFTYMMPFHANTSPRVGITEFSLLQWRDYLASSRHGYQETALVA